MNSIAAIRAVPLDNHNFISSSTALRCTHLRLTDGTTLRMTEAWRRMLKEQFEEMALTESWGDVVCLNAEHAAAGALTTVPMCCS